MCVLDATVVGASRRLDERSAWMIFVIAVVSCLMTFVFLVVGSPFTPNKPDFDVPGRVRVSMLKALRPTWRTRLLLLIKEVTIGILASFYVLLVAPIVVGQYLAVAELVAAVLEILTLRFTLSKWRETEMHADVEAPNQP
ncbi:hypothetical protein BC938DRAFT_475805 [Jimgerdemannia flammicorona]|nr:hypothetical protein BC938DRAFT_475805 [Jimgerdemannia flammicorona]